MGKGTKIGGRSEEGLRVVGSGRGRKVHEIVGLGIPRHFTEEGRHPFDAIEWEVRSAKITNERGEVVFEQHDCEVPASWSQLAANIVAHREANGPFRNRSALKDLRIVE